MTSDVETQSRPDDDTQTSPAATEIMAPVSVKPADPARHWRGGADRPILLTVGVSLAVLSVLILGFVVYLVGISSVQEGRSQITLYNKLRSELGNATAPVDPAAPGSPVAILDIPSIGIQHMVVVQGTSAGNLTKGPGLRTDTPLPGKVGVSVIFGRRSTFGAPFARVPSLKVGTDIVATTGHGISHYRVTSIVRDGKQLTDDAPNRLVLVTADSSFVPDRVVMVSATLVNSPAADGSRYPSIASNQQAMGNDSTVLFLLVLWSIALTAAAAGGAVAARFWSRWPAWVLTAPVLAAALWNVYENAAHLLPNIF